MYRACGMHRTRIRREWSGRRTVRVVPATGVRPTLPSAASVVVTPRKFWPARRAVAKRRTSLAKPPCRVGAKVSATSAARGHPSNLVPDATFASDWSTWTQCASHSKLAHLRSIFTTHSTSFGGRRQASDPRSHLTVRAWPRRRSQAVFPTHPHTLRLCASPDAQLRVVHTSGSMRICGVHDHWTTVYGVLGSETLLRGCVEPRRSVTCGTVGTTPIRG